AIENYCVSCDWSQLVTWYKAVISHVVCNDVTSDILLTTLHVITDWRISDHMIGTSQRSRPTIGVPMCPGRSQGVRTIRGREAIYKQPPAPALPPSGRLYTTTGWEVVEDIC
ncbi:unnamed protein product, partial [Staurois parvus]